MPALHALHGTLPSAVTMGVVGLAALFANGAVFGLLWAYRQGDANMRSVWICSRNDVLGNLAVLLAALGVLGTGTRVDHACLLRVRLHRPPFRGNNFQTGLS